MQKWFRPVESRYRAKFLPDSHSDARLSDVTDRWRHCRPDTRAGVPLQTIPGPECCNAPSRQKCPPLAQERAQLASPGGLAGNGAGRGPGARVGERQPWHLGAGLLFGRATVNRARFLPKKRPRGTETVQVWYRSGRKLAVSWGLRAPGVPREPDKTPSMEDGLSGRPRPA